MQCILSMLFLCWGHAFVAEEGLLSLGVLSVAVWLFSTCQEGLMLTT